MNIRVPVILGFFVIFLFSGDTMAEKPANLIRAKIITRIDRLVFEKSQTEPQHKIFFCPNGQPPVEISNGICQEPVEYTCTAYWCTDQNGRQSLAVFPGKRPNPECKKAPLQEQPCTNNVKMPERYLPSRKELVETMPRFFPEDYLKVPLLGVQNK